MNEYDGDYSKLVDVVSEEVGYEGGNAALELTHRQIQHLAREWREAGFEHEASYAVAFQESERPVVLTILESDAEPASTPEAYLKLHLLSHRLVRPHGVVLSGIFPLLPNVAWTNEGAVDLNELPERQLLARLNGKVLEVNSVDKFPKMTDYVVPAGVRIADSARVRLGAYVGEGTTVMHEGFINFNAGTEGPGMIEGRISAGVFVGKGSDLGGSSSTMGTLSGGGNIVISVGEGCLIGANAGTQVRAVHGGRVVFADWLRGAGLLVILDHGNGYLSLYGHNQSLLRDAGDIVKAGDPIATVGTSGGQETAALYFAIRQHGRPSDPAQWCRAQG